jgi:trehalose 6-phosphate synthase
VSVPTRGATRAGGLEVALQGVFRQRRGIWLGWSGKVCPPAQIETRTTEADGQQYVTTDLSDEDYNEYYNGYANRVLWPILHYRLDLAEYSFRDLTGYTRVNQHFADELDKLLRPDDVIWVHDYHLLLLAKALRERGHRNRIGFFLHTPLPPAEILTALPGHDKVFPALCHYDLIGFQTETDATNFARYLVHQCKLASRNLRTFLFDGRYVHLGVFPVGVAVDEIRQWAERSVRSSFVRRVVDSLNGRTMMIGVDRLDYSKGIVPRMEAFERLLEKNQEWRGRVTFLQITPRSRQKIREYIEMERLVNATVGRINGRHGGVEWTPIRYVNQSYPRSSLAGLYRCARIGLVTPLRDGMNLVAKEFVVSQDPQDPGVLVLSRFAGAAAECEAALLVNPYDTESTAEAIEQGLAMPLDERRERHAAMMKQLQKSDIRHWGTNFLAALEEGEDEGIFSAFPVPSGPAARAMPHGQATAVLERKYYE